MNNDLNYNCTASLGELAEKQKGNGHVHNGETVRFMGQTCFPPNPLS